MGSYIEEIELRGSNNRVQIDTTTIGQNSTLAQVSAHELNAELDRRRIAKEKELTDLAREMYNLGYSYEQLDDLISEA